MISLSRRRGGGADVSGSGNKRRQGRPGTTCKAITVANEFGAAVIKPLEMRLHRFSMNHRYSYASRMLKIHSTALQSQIY
jgi:hypothetical protein